MAPLAAIAFGLYPNTLSLVPDKTPDRPHGLILQSSDSAGFISPHKHKSAFSSYEAYGRPVDNNTWFTYHLLSRVQSGGGGGGKLRVWDLTRISTMFLVFLSRTYEIEFRGGFITLDDGVRVKCPPRTAVALEGFRRKVKTVLELGIEGNVLNRKQAEVVQTFLEILEEDMK
jgi:hypothetical protein